MGTLDCETLVSALERFPIGFCLGYGTGSGGGISPVGHKWQKATLQGCYPSIPLSNMGGTFAFLDLL